jgi:F0F1-type ATP synthase assembly protein I
MATDGDKPGNESSKQLSGRELASTAISLGFSVAVFVILGVVLDNIFKTAPVFVLLGVFFALASMVYFFVRLFKAASTKR